MLADMEKATFRLPEWEMRRLRQQSERQRRALNSVVVEVIARGLGEEPQAHEVLHALGSMVARPPLGPYEPPPREDEPEDAQLTEALDWARDDR
jgi:hypothetical protein